MFAMLTTSQQRSGPVCTVCVWRRVGSSLQVTPFTKSCDPSKYVKILTWPSLWFCTEMYVDFPTWSVMFYMWQQKLLKIFTVLTQLETAHKCFTVRLYTISSKDPVLPWRAHCWEAQLKDSLFEISNSALFLRCNPRKKKQIHVWRAIPKRDFSILNPFLTQMQHTPKYFLPASLSVKLSK